MPRFIDVEGGVPIAAAKQGRAVLNIDGQVVGTADNLPNESGFIWMSEPAAVDGKVYMGTVADDRGSWVQEWTQPDADGPFWLHRYFMGFNQLIPGELDKLGRDDLRDDHSPASCAVAAGKPLVAFWSGHGVDNRLHYRISDQNVDDARPGELTFGPIQTFEIPSDERTTYAEVMINGNDIWVAHRTGYNTTTWTLTKFPDWATGTPVSQELVISTDQSYLKARMVDGVIRCMASDHPFTAADNKIWYCEVDLDTGDVTEADGTVLGNLDGTNLPLAQADLELVFTSTGSSRPWGFDVGYGATRQLVFADGDPSAFGSTGKYRYARYDGGSWTVSEVSSVGTVLSNSVGAYFPSITFVPGNDNQVLLCRSAGGTHYVEKWGTADSGVTWSVAEVVDSSLADNATGIPRKALWRAYPVRTESGTAPFDVIGTDIRNYPNYFYGWEIYIRPLPLSHPVKRVPADSAIPRGLTSEPSAPTGGLYLPGTTGHYIEGPTDVVAPADGIRFEVDVALPDWTPAANVALLSKESSGSKREPRLYINTAGRVGVYWSEDGSTAQELTPTNQSVPAAAWQRVQIAADFIPSHAHPTTGGTQKTFRCWYRFTDEQAWVPLTSTQVSSGTSLFTSDSPWEIGSRWGGTTDLSAAVWYRASVMTPGGEVLAEWRADRSSDQGVQVDEQGNTWTIKSRELPLNRPVLTLPRIDYLTTTTGKVVAALQSTGVPDNYLVFASGDNAPQIQSGGSDTDVGIGLYPKGTGKVTVGIGLNPVGVKVPVPASASAPGATGQWAADSSYIYVCVGVDSWVRASAASW